jgi:hypothetical protein
MFLRLRRRPLCGTLWPKRTPQPGLRRRRWSSASGCVTLGPRQHRLLPSGRRRSGARTRSKSPSDGTEGFACRRRCVPRWRARHLGAEPRPTWLSGKACSSAEGIGELRLTGRSVALSAATFGALACRTRCSKRRASPSRVSQFSASAGPGRSCAAKIKSASIHRGAEQGVRARQRLWARDRISFLPRLPDCGSTVFWYVGFGSDHMGIALDAFAHPSMP